MPRSIFLLEKQIVPQILKKLSLRSLLSV